MSTLLSGNIPMDWLTNGTADHSVTDVSSRVSVSGVVDPLALLVGTGSSPDGAGHRRPFTVPMYNWLEWVMDRRAQLAQWQAYSDAYRQQGGSVDVPPINVGVAAVPPSSIGTGGGGGSSTAATVDTGVTLRLDRPSAGGVSVPPSPGGDGTVLSTPLPAVVWLPGLHHPDAFLSALHRSMALRLGCAADEFNVTARVTSRFDRVVDGDDDGDADDGPQSATVQQQQPSSSSTAPGASIGKPGDGSSSVGGGGITGTPNRLVVTVDGDDGGGGTPNSTSGNSGGGGKRANVRKDLSVHIRDSALLPPSREHRRLGRIRFCARAAHAAADHAAADRAAAAVA